VKWRDKLALSRGAAFQALIVCVILSCQPAATAEIQPNFVGQLLVATDGISDPRFAEAVIYIAKHDPEGALGLIVNRPLAKGAVDDLLKSFGAEAKQSKREVTIYYGGPVSTLQGFVLHSEDVTLESSMRVKDGLAVTSDVKMIEAIASGKGPKQYLILLGYTGWAPGQLEAEINNHAWFLVPADKSLIFGKDAESKWHQATERRQTPL